MDKDLLAIWETAIALQQLEKGSPSYFMKEAARACAQKGSGIENVTRLVEEFYQRYPDRSGMHIQQSDLVTIHAAGLLLEETFVLAPVQLLHIGEQLFAGAEDVKEELPGGLAQYPVRFAGVGERDGALQFLFSREADFDYAPLDARRVVDHLARWIAALWQVHPFEGSNTQAMAIFMLRYLEFLGFAVDYQYFSAHVTQFQEGLIMACYVNLPAGRTKDLELLRGLIWMLVEAGVVEAAMPGADGVHTHAGDENNQAGALSLDPQQAYADVFEVQDGESQAEEGQVVRRAKSFRREEEVLALITENPALTLAEISAQLGCSESTVKRALHRLMKANTVQRTGARKKGRWEVVTSHQE